MTSAGVRILTLMLDGNPWKVQPIGRRLQLCRRKVQGTLNGAVLAGLVDDVTPDREGVNTRPAQSYQITDEGREAVALMGD